MEKLTLEERIINQLILHFQVIKSYQKNPNDNTAEIYRNVDEALSFAKKLGFD